MARIRTTKKLAARIELEYFKRSHPLRRWLRILSFGAPAIAVAWLIVLAARGDQRIYTSGPVSAKHSMFGADCGRCHTPEVERPSMASATFAAGRSPAIFWRRVSDDACQKCHDGPVHHDNQAFTPECSTCHVEHRERLSLTSLTDRHCTQCHSDLKTRGAAPRFERTISGFPASHPEFAVIMTGRKDTAQMKLNHEKHLKAGLRGPKGPVQMTCSDCHRPIAVAASWPFSQASMVGPAGTPGEVLPPAKGQAAYMDPIGYATHCAGCHPLDFDPRFPGTVAPHDEPEVVQAFLLAKFTEGPPKPPEPPKEEEEGDRSRLPGRRKGTIEQKEEKQDEEESPRRLPGRRARAEDEEKEDQEEGGRARLPGRRKAGEEKEPPGESIAAQVRAAERLLFKKCQECHMLEIFPDKLPSVAATAIPARWLVHSVFNHRSHRMLTCLACHEKAPTSQETSDVLLPGIQACLQCHRMQRGARSDCVECHLYHDKTKERDMNGPLTIQAVVTGAPPPAPVRPHPAPSGR